MMSKNVVIAVVVVILLVLAGWYLMRPKQSGVSSETVSVPTQVPVASSVAPSASEGAVTAQTQQITVSATDFAFTPAKLSVKKGDRIKIVLQNNGKLPHNLMIDELKVATKTIQAGQTDTVEFVASQAGSFSMYCSVDSHRQKGMEGAVSVE